jgi:hypothetical protein
MIFHHSYLVNNWEQILKEQIDKIIGSGLYDHSLGVFCCAIGSEKEQEKYLKLISKHKKLFPTKITDVNIQEQLTLNVLHEVRHHNMIDCAIFYLHTKGVTAEKQHVSNVRDWRVYMEYYNIVLWKDMLLALDEYDVVGVNFKTKPWPHFSGNFWWSTVEYISSLPSPVINTRSDSESWIGINNPRFLCSAASGINHYAHSFPTFPKQIFGDEVDGTYDYNTPENDPFLNNPEL